MQIEVSRKEFLSLCALVVLLSGIFMVGALTGAWHPLQQVSTDSGGSTSVDANNNGKVDDSDKVGGLSSSQLLAQGTPGRSIVVAVARSVGSSCPAGFDQIFGSGISINNGQVIVGDVVSSPGEGIYANNPFGAGNWCVKRGITEITVVGISGGVPASCPSGFTAFHISTGGGGFYGMGSNIHGVIVSVPVSGGGSTIEVYGSPTPHKATTQMSSGQLVHCLKTD